VNDNKNPESNKRLISPAIRVSREDCPSPHSKANKLGRVLWAIVWALLFRPSPIIMLGWRRMLLRLFGARIGKGAKIMPSTKIWAPWNLTMSEEACLSHNVDCYCVAPVSIGAHATVSQYSFLCTATHDVQDPHMRLVTAPIVIGDGAWVAADVFVAPGITIEEGAVVGVRSSVFKDMPAWTICAGQPCRPIRKRELRSSIKDACNPSDHK
jgi:putative colanic acid biosynthesis acetyltransferase WcaF